MSLPRLFLLVCCAIFALSGCAPVTPTPPAWDLVLAAPAGATADAAQSAADAYAQATGLRVGVQTFSDDSYLDHIFAALLAGSGEFDLVYLSAESLAKWEDYQMLQPLNLFPEVDVNNSAWVKLMEIKSGEGIAVFGVPVEPDVDVLWYRADILEAAGVEVPRDLDAFSSVLDQLKQAQKMTPLAISAGELDAGFDLVALLGPDALIEWNGPGRRVNVQALREALSFYRGVGDNTRLMVDPNSTDWTRTDVQEALSTGQAAMGILPLSAAGELLDCEHSPDVCKDGKPLLAFAPLPGMEDTLGIGSLQAWAVPLKAPHLDAAQAFARWLVSEEGARAWANGGGLPAHRAVLAEMGGPVENALAKVSYFRPAFPPLIPAVEIWQALDTAGHGAAVGEPPEMLVEALVRSIETALRQSGYTVIEE